MSRNQKELNDQYPEIVEAVGKLYEEQFIVDGELVAFQGRLTSFSMLQGRMHAIEPSETLTRKVKVYYYLFDILYLDGYDLTQISQRHRKSILKSVFKFEDPLR